MGLDAAPIDSCVDPTENIPPSVRPLRSPSTHHLQRTTWPGKSYPGGADININLVVTPSRIDIVNTENKQNQEHTRYLVNNVTFKVPDVPVLLQTLSGKHNAADLLPEGSIYPVMGNKSVELSIAAGAPVGPVSVQSLHHRLCLDF
ncbi:hypothetical protein EDB83DRAFT_2515825 [Lactarius deliciosus]|nr:hypothetical protein EDB83DRAFT_2515825 [Lactarius deliciosus]